MPNPIQISTNLLDSLVATANRCGGQQQECILYVTAAVSRPDLATDFIHPFHESSPVSTTVGLDELHRVWDTLLENNCQIILQVHTHPGEAFHSSIDDGFPIVHSRGFPSLVLPFFGKNPIESGHLAIYQGGGQWLSPNLNEWDQYLRIQHDA